MVKSSAGDAPIKPELYCIYLTRSRSNACFCLVSLLQIASFFILLMTTLVFLTPDRLNISEWLTLPRDKEFCPVPPQRIISEISLIKLGILPRK